MGKRFARLLRAHKFLSAGAAVLLVCGGVFVAKAYTSRPPETRYVLGTARIGSIFVSTTGTGQVSSSSQVDVKAKASGDVVKLYVKQGQEVKAGALLATLNARDAWKSVRDAQISLQSAQLSLDKMRRAAGVSDLLAAQDALQAAKDAREKLALSQELERDRDRETEAKAKDDLVKAYEDAFNAISDAFLDLPDTQADLHDVLYATDIADSEITLGNHQENADALLNTADVDEVDRLRPYATAAKTDEETARVAYLANFDRYRATSRYADHDTVEALLGQTLETVKTVAQSEKSESNFLDAWADLRAQHDRPVYAKVAEYQSMLASRIGNTNGHLSSLLAIGRTLTDSRNAITNAQRDLRELDLNGPRDLAGADADIREREAALADVNDGADSFDLRAQELSVRQRQLSLSDARERLGDYAVRAPFAGLVADLPIRKGENVSTGTTAATLVTKERTAEITLNELDAAKVAVGEKVTLTFDAIPELSLTGTVGEIDALGTVSQGVVTYGVTVLLDTQDERMKPGMSVSAAIVTEERADVVTVPSLAVKQARGQSYVEVFDGDLFGGDTPQGGVSATPPRRQPVEVGISSDTATEIVSGLKAGDRIVVRTVTGAKAATASSAPSLFGAPGGARGANGGGAVRFGGGR